MSRARVTIGILASTLVIASGGDVWRMAPAAATQQLLELEGDVAPVHDPVAIKERGTYYVFCTGGRNGSGVIPIRTSTDMRTWRAAGFVFDTLPDWAMREIPKARNAWAPDVARYSGRYLLYYSVSSFGSRNSAAADLAPLGVTARRPASGLAWATTTARGDCSCCPAATMSRAAGRSMSSSWTRPRRPASMAGAGRPWSRRPGPGGTGCWSPPARPGRSARSCSGPCTTAPSWPRRSPTRTPGSGLSCWEATSDDDAGILEANPGVRDGLLELDILRATRRSLTPARFAAETLNRWTFGTDYSWAPPGAWDGCADISSSAPADGVAAVRRRCHPQLDAGVSIAAAVLDGERIQLELARDYPTGELAQADDILDDVRELLARYRGSRVGYDELEPDRRGHARPAAGASRPGRRAGRPGLPGGLCELPGPCRRAHDPPPRRPDPGQRRAAWRPGARTPKPGGSSGAGRPDTSMRWWRRLSPSAWPTARRLRVLHPQRMSGAVNSGHG